MIILPENGWQTANEGDASGSLLTGEPKPLPLGNFVIHAAPFATPPDDDPVTKADAMRERAGQVFQRHRAISAFNRELDTLFTNIAERPEWSEGLRKFDLEIGNLRQKHGATLRNAEDRVAFERHADEFAAMQRIGLKRALVERQQSDALALLDDLLAYYASKAAVAPNEVFREIAIDAGLRTIEEQREAGYLFPGAATKVEAQFLARVDVADNRPPPPSEDYDEAWNDWMDNNIEQNEIVPPNREADPGINVGIPPRGVNPGVPEGQPNPPAPIKSQDI